MNGFQAIHNLNAPTLFIILLSQTFHSYFWRSPLIKNQKNLFCKSVNLESHLAIPFNRLLDVVPPDGRVWKLLSSLLVVLESTQWFFLHLQFCWNALRSPPVMIQKTYMQWFMIRCHACVCTWFWNIGPIIFFYFMKLSLDMSLLLKSYAGSFLVLPIISLRRSLWLSSSSPFLKIYDLYLPLCHAFVKCFSLVFKSMGFQPILNT